MRKYLDSFWLNFPYFYSSIDNCVAKLPKQSQHILLDVVGQAGGFHLVAQLPGPLVALLVLLAQLLNVLLHEEAVEKRRFGMEKRRNKLC